MASPLQDAWDGSAEGPWVRSVVAASPSHELEADLAGLLGEHKPPSWIHLPALWPDV